LQAAAVLCSNVVFLPVTLALSLNTVLSERPSAAAAAAPAATDVVQIDLVQCSLQQLTQQRRLWADTVIMNPPFGTKQKGADMEFLRAACSLARTSVYSLHKSSTRAHIQKVALR
jgi:predicted RNA methylase